MEKTFRITLVIELEVETRSEAKKLLEVLTDEANRRNALVYDYDMVQVFAEN